MVADQAFLVALAWLVLRVTGSGAELGVVLAVASIPGTVLTPAGGVLSDRYSPALILIWASVGRVLLLALLTVLILTGAIQLWHVYVIAASLSALDALYYPASMSIVPALVDNVRLGPANALIQGAEQASSIFGPALAGSLVALLGLGASFGATAVLFLIATAVFGAVARAAKPAVSRADDASEEGDEQSRAMISFVQGIRYVWRDEIIRSLLPDTARNQPRHDGTAVRRWSRPRRVASRGGPAPSARWLGPQGSGL